MALATDVQGSPLLAQLDAALKRDTACLQLRSSLARLVQQTASPLSAIRTEAWAGVVALVEGALAEGAAGAPLRQVALLEALRLEWPALLSRLHDTLTAAAAPAPSPSPAGGSRWAAMVSRAPTTPELTAAVRTLLAACLLHPPARQDCTSLLLKPLLEQATAGDAPALQCACLDVLLAMQSHHADAFVAFTRAGGVETLCQLVKSSPNVVRSKAVATLNLMFTHQVPVLLPDSAVPPSTPAAATPAGGEQQPEGLDEQQAEVWQCLQAAKEVTGAALGREARGMLLRRIPLGDPDSRRKLDQLAHAMELFLESS